MTTVFLSNNLKFSNCRGYLFHSEKKNIKHHRKAWNSIYYSIPKTNKPANWTLQTLSHIQNFGLEWTRRTVKDLLVREKRHHLKSNQLSNVYFHSWSHMHKTKLGHIYVFSTLAEAFRSLYASFWTHSCLKVYCVISAYLYKYFLRHIMLSCMYIAHCMNFPA